MRIFITITILLNLILQINAQSVLQNKLMSANASILLVPQQYPTIKSALNASTSLDTILVSSGEYFDCLIIDKPITIIGKGINETKITGDTIKPVIIVQSDSVTIKNLSVIAKIKIDGIFSNCSLYIPTNGMEILSAFNVNLDSLLIRGGVDSSSGFTSGGNGLYLRNSANIFISNSIIFGADTKNEQSYSCSNKRGGDGLKVINCDSLNIFDCEITGGKGANGWRMGGVPIKGGYGGHSLNLKGSFNIKVSNSRLIGGIGGKTAASLVYYTEQAKAGDGAFCDSTNALFMNSILQGGTALTNSPPYNVPLNTLGGNGITGVNYSTINIDGGDLIPGTSSEDAMGEFYFVDSTSSITISNLILDTTINNILLVEYYLYQNYPNPFNPSTKIRWQSPVGRWQTLKVYDVLGNEVATLVDEYREAGRYEVEFKSSIGNRQLANGVYFYRLQAGDHLEIKKMILLK